MPGFVLTGRAGAPVEEVWKLLFDPTRFPEWWAGVETIQPGPTGEFTLWPDGYPDFPMDQRIEASTTPGTVTISCLVSDLVFRWTLHESGAGTDVDVHVEIPESEARRVPEQQRLLDASLTTLARLASR